jgi:hypothetical protein
MLYLLYGFMIIKFWVSKPTQNRNPFILISMNDYMIYDFLAADEKCRNIITVKYRVKENFKSNNNIKAKNNIKIINNDLNDEGITTQNNLTKANQKKLKSNNKKFNRFSRKSFLAKKLNSSKKEKSGNFNSNSNKATTTSTTQSFLSKKKPRKTNG